MTPNSNCSSLCDDSISDDPSLYSSSSTQPSNFYCSDWELSGLNSSAGGRKWMTCIECESTSSHYDRGSTENDVYWFLCNSLDSMGLKANRADPITVNIKATIDWCVFGYPLNPNITAANAQCNNICAGAQNQMQEALVDHSGPLNRALQYQYCEDGSAAFSENVNACISCLESLRSTVALINCTLSRPNVRPIMKNTEKL